MATDDSSNVSLSELFQDGWNIQKKIDNAELVASNKDFNVLVDKAIHQLEEATRLVSELDMFSKNESVEEIATVDLKYILLPALLGDLVSQLMIDEDRIISLQRAQVYFVDFLQRCKDYAITNQDVPTITDDRDCKDQSDSSCRVQRPKGMEQLAMERREKIDRLKAKKETEKKLRELEKVVVSCDSLRHLDDETIREHILTLLNLWVYKALDNINSIKQEIDLLEQMKVFKRDLPLGAVIATTQPIKKDSSRLPLKPFVITKDMLKDKVFGAGYPSLPTMSVEEFYDQNYGNVQPPEMDNNPTQNKEDEKEETEEEETERLKRERDFDDFKDVNRRGWGNRKNQG